MWKYNSCLIHEDRTDHKYIEKHIGKSGEYVYTYARAVSKQVQGHRDELLTLQGNTQNTLRTTTMASSRS